MIILVVAAHPDDELLGPGATLCKHVELGDTIHALILGQGALSRDALGTADVQALLQQSQRAAAIIGIHTIRFAQFPDNAFDTVSLLEITKHVEKTIDTLRPDIVYTHHEYDLNIDHRRTFEAVLTACRPCNGNAPKTIFTFETLSSTEWQSKDQKQFHPTTYVDVEKTLDYKLQALACYTSEMRSYPHPRSPEGVRLLAGFRGLECGLRVAEAFHLVRDIR